MIGLGKAVQICDGLTKTYGERFSTPDLLREMADKGEHFMGGLVRVLRRLRRRLWHKNNLRLLMWGKVGYRVGERDLININGDWLATKVGVYGMWQGSVAKYLEMQLAHGIDRHGNC